MLAKTRSNFELFFRTSRDVQTTGEVPKMNCSPMKNLDLSEEKMDTIDGKIGEKSMESKMKSEENVGVSEAQAKNIPKIYREISPMSGAYAPAVIER